MSTAEYEHRSLVETQARLRVGDDDRSQAVQRLCAACAAGQLTLDEFDQRAAAAWHAVTRGDLAQATRDLPVDRSTSAAGDRCALDGELTRPARSAIGVFTMLVIWGLLSSTAPVAAAALTMLTLVTLPVAVVVADIWHSADLWHRAEPPSS